MEKKAQKSQVKKQRYITFFVMLVMLAASVFAQSCFAEPEHNYAVRKDLSVYFSNSDDVICSIREAMKRRDWRVTITYRSHSDNTDDIPELIRDLMAFALDETDDPTEGDYIYHQYGGYELKFSSDRSGSRYTHNVSIYPEHYTTAEQEKQVAEAVNEIIESFGFDESTTDHEKVRAVYDFVRDHTDFDEVHEKNENYHLKVTAFGALIYGRAVCQGYSVLMYRLLREVGIDARVITGTAQYPDGEEFHAWNIVRIDGEYYNIDVTWDDQEDSEEYFLKSDGDFPFHIRDEQYATEDFYGRYPMAEKNYTP